MTGLRIRTLQVDVPGADHDAALAYWTGAVDGHDGGTGDGPFTHLHGARSPIAVHVQRVDDAVAGRYHLDLEAGDVDAEVERLVALGATVVSAGACTVLRDPAGLLLCVCEPQAVDEHLRPGVTAAPRVHLVVLDVPSHRLDAVVRFWSEALDLGVHPVGGRFAAYTFLGESAAPPLAGIGLLVQDIGEADARIHVDLHVPTAADRDREVARLEGLGATRAAAHDAWVVLDAPGGHLHCIVPDQRD